MESNGMRVSGGRKTFGKKSPWWNTVVMEWLIPYSMVLVNEASHTSRRLGTLAIYSFLFIGSSFFLFLRLFLFLRYFFEGCYLLVSRLLA